MGFSGRIAANFQRHALTPLIALVALLLGVFATLITPREEEPQIDVTMANVFVPFPGASARDVEALVAGPAEQVLSRIAGVEHVFSVSRPGMAVITVQYRVGEDPVRALVRLYDTVHSQRDWLAPDLGVLEPVVKPKGIDDVPIVTLTLHGAAGSTAANAVSADELQQVARSIEGELKRIPGTRDVTTIGGPGHVLRVVMDSARMQAHDISAQDLKAALQLANSSQPGGSLVAGNRTVEVQTGTWLESAADVRRLVVGVRDGRPVFMEDVASIVDGPDRPTNFVWFGNGPAAQGATRSDILPAVTLTITKKPGTNAADVADAAITRANALKGAVIPDGVGFTVTRNYGETATDKAQQLIGKLVFATAFVVLLVLFALGRREALIVGTAVTLTLAATLFASWAWGFTLNRVSLFALIFSIGILVDDAIVVVENIHRHWRMPMNVLAEANVSEANVKSASADGHSQNIHRHAELEPGKPLWQVIPAAVDEVGGPTILATFTVIAALLPMAFVSGLMGPYMSPIPINASMGMFISLAIAFVITPWLALKLLGQPTVHAPHAAAPDEPASRLERLFRRILTPFLDERQGRGRRARTLLWLGLLLAILASLALAGVKLVVLKMLPFDNKSEFQVVLDMPVGTPLENTARTLREIGAYLATVDEVRDYQAYAGVASPINFNGLVRQYYLRTAPEMGDIQVNLADKKHRHRRSHEIATAVRDRIAAIARQSGGNAKVVEVPPGPPVLAPIVAEIYGPDYAGQIAVAKQVRAQFEAAADIVGVDDSSSAAAEKIILRVNRTRAAQLGVAQRDIVDTLGLALAEGGQNVTPLHDGSARYEIPVRVVLPAGQRSSIETLLALRVRSRQGVLLPLADLVDAVGVPREQAIHHKDLLPVVYVTGDMGGRLDSPLYGMFDIRSRLHAAKFAETGGPAPEEYFVHPPYDPYAGYSLKWDGEWQITYETFRDMGAAYAVGLILIYLLVVAQFGNYLVPLIVMAPIPLTVIGVLPGHALAGSQFTATSMIGMIALAGIIVRNSILLVDFINRQLAAGMAFAEAVIQAAAVRAKPIALTALAAMLGALFILDDPIFNGLALSLISGILVSTLLTLVAIPVLYYAVMRGRVAIPAPTPAAPVVQPTQEETS